MEFLIGILCGVALSLVLGFGPAFFALIQNSLHYGHKRTFFFILGVLSSDAIIVFLMLTVLRNANMEAVLRNIYVATIGGAVLIFLGVKAFSKKSRRFSDAQQRVASAPMPADEPRWRLFLNGFILNFLNPLIWLYWVSIIAFLSAEVGLTAADRYIFFAGLLLALLGCDVLKSRLASMMTQWFTPKVMKVFNSCIGLILIAFGIYLIVSMIAYRTNPEVRERQSEQPQSTRIIQTLHDHIGRDTNRSGDTFWIQ